MFNFMAYFNGQRFDSTDFAPQTFGESLVLLLTGAVAAASVAVVARRDSLTCSISHRTVLAQSEATWARLTRRNEPKETPAGRCRPPRMPQHAAPSELCKVVTRDQDNASHYPPLCREHSIHFNTHLQRASGEGVGCNSSTDGSLLESVCQQREQFLLGVALREFI